MRRVVGLLCLMVGLLVLVVLVQRSRLDGPSPHHVGPYIPPNAYARGVRAVLPLTASAYNCVAAQTDSTPWVTASGMRCGYPVIAVSRDLLKHLPYGTVVTVDGKRFVVGDTMARRFRRRIDMPMASRGQAMRFGIRKTILKVPR